jgi:ABC-type dipeptide/oligopeptide/nickel transport system permease subunit
LNKIINIGQPTGAVIVAVAGENAKPVALISEEFRPRSFWQHAWAQFSANRFALAGLIIIIMMVILAITADFWQGMGLIASPLKQYPNSRMKNAMTCAPPEEPGAVQYCFVIGSDDLGRDMLSRVVYGTQTSLTVGMIGMLIAMSVGILYGLAAGYYGGWVDNIMMRIIDILYGLPSLVIIIMMQVYFMGISTAAKDPQYANSLGPIALAAVELNNRMNGLFFMMVAIALLSWIGVARQTRGQVLQYKEKEFVEAARAVGARDRRIIFVHLLPNIVGPLIILAASAVPGFVYTEAALSFLGIGIRPPAPSWGAMIDFAYKNDFRSHPEWVIGAGGMLTLMVLAFTFVGDGLRDAFDPRLRGQQ